MNAVSETLERSGSLWFRQALGDGDLTVFDEASAEPARPGARLTLAGDLGHAIRSGPLSTALASLSPALKPVRMVSFSKSGEGNWSVPWHQDRIIAVRERTDTDGFGNWSCKSGVWHCEPPVDLLQRMIFVRVHLDDTDDRNGAMQIARASHTRGLVPATEAEAVAKTCPHETCAAKRGDVQVLKMLTLHRSRPSRSGAPRRVFRIDYAAEELPEPLGWAV